MQEIPNKKLQKARKRRNLTIEGLAKELEVSTLTVWRWENKGQVPHPVTMGKLKEFFKLSEEDLGFGHIFESDEKNSEGDR